MVQLTQGGTSSHLQEGNDIGAARELYELGALHLSKHVGHGLIDDRALDHSVCPCAFRLPVRHIPGLT